MDQYVSGDSRAAGSGRGFSSALIIGLAVAAVAVSLLAPTGWGLERRGMVSLAILFVAVIFWATEVVNATVTSLLILSLLPTLGALTYAEAFVGLGQPMLWRLVGILMVTLGLSASGLDRRFATAVLKLARGNVYVVLLLMVISAQLLVFVVPTPPARAGLLAVTYLGILQGLNIRPPSNLGKVIFLAIPVFSLITSASTFTGASVEVYSLGLFSTLLHFDFTYLSWMLVNLPVNFVSCLIVLMMLLILFPLERTRLEGADDLIDKELARMGALKPAEKKMMVLAGILLLMWFTGISDRVPAEIMVATVMFIPGIGILTWSQAQKGTPWGIVLLYGASLSLAMALQQNGVVDWITSIFLSRVAGMQAAALAFLVLALCAIVRLGMTNMTGVVATLFPLAVSLANSVGVNPVWLGMICVLGSATGFFYPSQNVCSIITYSYGYYTGREMAVVGFWVVVLTSVVITLMALWYWPMVGIPVMAR